MNQQFIHGNRTGKEVRDLNYSDLVLTVQIFSLCKDKRTDFM